MALTRSQRAAEEAERLRAREKQRGVEREPGEAAKDLAEAEAVQRVRFSIQQRTSDVCHHRGPTACAAASHDL